MPRHSSGGGPSGSGKPLRGNPKDSPEVRLSKTLSWILRHGAKSEGLYMRTDGYVRVSDLVRLDFRYKVRKLMRHLNVIAGFAQIIVAARPRRPAAHSGE